MKAGLYVPNFGAWGDPEAMVSLAVDGEASGWDGFFVWDHIGGFEHTMVDPWVALGAVAQATTTITIGTTVTPVPRRRPQKLARETTTVDRLSRGRLVLGVGTGEGPPEFDDMGENPEHPARGEMLDEALDVITELWTGERVHHRGPHYTIDGARFLPTPVQTPRIPIWVGGVWPHTRPMRRAARWDGVMPLLQLADGEEETTVLRACLDYVSSHRETDEPFDVVYSGATPGDDPTRAAEIVRTFAAVGVTWWLEPIAPYRFGEGFDEPWDVDRLRERVLQGPPRI